MHESEKWKWSRSVGGEAKAQCGVNPWWKATSLIDPLSVFVVVVCVFCCQLYSLSWYTLPRSFSTMYSPVTRASIEHNGCNIRAFDQGEMGLHKLPWNLTRWYFIISIQMSPEILRHAESKFLVINFFFTYKLLYTNTKLSHSVTHVFVGLCALNLFSIYLQDLR